MIVLIIVIYFYCQLAETGLTLKTGKDPSIMLR